MLPKRICGLIMAVLMLFQLYPALAAGMKASSLQQFASEVEKHTVLLESSFSVPCSQDVADELQKVSSAGGGGTQLSEIMTRAGCVSYSFSSYNGSIHFSGIAYYTGWNILHRWQAGKMNLLSSRETEVLERALSLVSGASGNELEKERYIYDMLCSGITYETRDDGSGDKDCAIGALLNGRADCDGYADAMLLCCGLAGIPCRYIQGTSAIPSGKGSVSGSHLWNLVYIGHSWLMCDATWGDHDRAEPGYLYFNIGSRDASFSYLWNSDTQFNDISPMADFSAQLMPDQQPAIIRSQEDAYHAARAASSAGIHQFSLFCPDEILWQTDSDTFRRMLMFGAVSSYSFSESGRLFEVSGSTLPDIPFCFCDSRTDILAAVRGYSVSGVHSFTLFFSPALADQMFADGHRQLQQVLSESCLAEAGRYSYATENGSVTLTGVSFMDASLPVCFSLDDVVSLIRREIPSRPSSLAFLLAGELVFDQISDPVFTAVYSLGAKSLSCSVSGNRITLSDLVYYDSYCIAETESDTLAYIRSVRSSGKSTLRVYCSDALYAFLSADGASAFFALLKQAGFTAYQVFYSDEYRLLGAEALR